MPQPTPASTSSRVTVFLLGLLAFACIALIGGSGYMKYRLDGAQSQAVSAVQTGDSDLSRLRAELGYSGFLGRAQAYVSTHDLSGIEGMRANIKTASALAAALPEKIAPDLRRDIQSITALFAAAMKKLDAPAGEIVAFGNEDLAPLYAALPVLDVRLMAADAVARTALQRDMQMWSMMLTFACWISLLIAAGCVAGLYTATRDRHSAPMRALAQSIQNMARGDMRTAIWGIERQDMIGDLARAVDLARYHFSQLPDLSLMSEDGPVRMRFEGGTRSLFEAMMKSISRDCETIRDQATGLSLGIAEQKNAMIALTEKVQSALNNVLANGQDGGRVLQQAVHEMTASTENLKNAHAHAADQLARLIPQMQERMQGMAEIAQLTGRHVAQTLQSLTLSEMNLKTNTTQAQETLTKLSSTADDLGTRMFGAINLLQASGKVLAETTEKIQNTINEGVNPPPAIDVDEEVVRPLTEKLDAVADKLAAIQSRLAETPDSAARDGERPQLDQAEFEDAMSHIRGKLEDLSLAVAQQESAPLNVEESLVPALLSGVEQLLAERDKQRPTPSATYEPSLAFDQIMAKLEQIGTSIAVGGGSAPSMPIDADAAPDLLAGMERLFATRVDPKLSSLEDAIAEKVRERFSEFSASLDEYKSIVLHGNEATQSQIKATLSNVESAFTALASSLPNDMRNSLEDDLERLSAQIEASGSIHAQVLGGKIDAKLAKLEQIVEQHKDATGGDLRQALQSMQDSLGENTRAIPTQIEQSLQDHWRNMGAQIDQLRNGVARLLDEHVAGRLMAFEGTLNSTKEAIDAAKLAVETPPKAVIAMGPEMQAQLHDQWIQVTSQIEAMRASLADSIAHQVGELEQRIAAIPHHAAQPQPAPMAAASGDEVQKQLDQQTEILAELVATLGVLDAHMEQIKTELRAKVG